MKISAALLASAANANPTTQTNSSTSGRGVRGFMGPSSQFEENPLPINDCQSNKDCWSSKIAKKKGWEDSDVKNLMCDKESGNCICKFNYMDANDDLKADGCESKISEDQCAYGSCEDLDVVPGAQCGAWRQLTCSAETDCCQCEDIDGTGACEIDMSMDGDGATCEEMCEQKCNESTDSTQPCMDSCNAACAEAMENGDEDEDKPEEDDDEKPDDEDEEDKPEDDGEKPDYEEDDEDKPDGPDDEDKPEDYDEDDEDKPDGEDEDDKPDDYDEDDEDKPDGPGQGCTRVFKNKKLEYPRF